MNGRKEAFKIESQGFVFPQEALLLHSAQWFYCLSAFLPCDLKITVFCATACNYAHLPLPELSTLRHLSAH